MMYSVRFVFWLLLPFLLFSACRREYQVTVQVVNQRTGAPVDSAVVILAELSLERGNPQTKGIYYTGPDGRCTLQVSPDLFFRGPLNIYAYRDDLYAYQDRNTAFLDDLTDGDHFELLLTDEEAEAQTWEEPAPPGYDLTTTLALLREGHYEELYLPAFGPDVIAQILAMDCTGEVIRVEQDFSEAPEDYYDCVALMQLIESVRLQQVWGAASPSVFPNLIYLSADTVYQIRPEWPGQTEEERQAYLRRAWMLYQNWWGAWETANRDSLLSISPLEGSGFGWE